MSKSGVSASRNLGVSGVCELKTYFKFVMNIKIGKKSNNKIKKNKKIAYDISSGLFALFSRKL